MKPIAWNGKKVAIVGGGMAALSLLLSFVYGWMIGIFTPENTLENDVGLAFLTAAWLISMLVVCVGAIWWIYSWLQNELERQVKPEK